jgi:uncharacterized membrane protein
MFQQKYLKILLVSVASLAIFESYPVSLIESSDHSSFTIGKVANAKSSGGRSGGGSFRGRSSGSSNRGSSKPSNSPSNNNNYNPGIRNQPYYDSRPVYGVNTYSSGSFFIGTFVIILFITVFIIILYIAFNSIKAPLNTSTNTSNSLTKERDNDIVTITKLQVALLANAKEVQKKLSDLTTTIDPNNAQGLLELLQESLLVLLRNSDYWDYALASSESLHIDQAQSRFNQLSMEERSKFSEETLTHILGKLQEKEVKVIEGEKAAYIVVTLLVGTADDKPLIESIYSPEQLKESLQKLTTIREDYLMTFEVMWSPQAENDSLTEDEFLMEYTQMIKLL